MDKGQGTMNNGRVKEIVPISSTEMTGTIYIQSKRNKMVAKLWELLAKTEPNSIESINQAITLLETITTINPNSLETAQAMQTLETLKTFLGGVK